MAGPQQQAEYVKSEMARFTRDGVGDLPEGHRLANGDAFFFVGYQGSSWAIRARRESIEETCLTAPISRP